jgi:hypothetical protein
MNPCCAATCAAISCALPSGADGFGNQTPSFPKQGRNGPRNPQTKYIVAHPAPEYNLSNTQITQKREKRSFAKKTRWFFSAWGNLAQPGIPPFFPGCSLRSELFRYAKGVPGAYAPGTMKTMMEFSNQGGGYSESSPAMA